MATTCSALRIPWLAVSRRPASIKPRETLLRKVYEADHALIHKLRIVATLVFLST
jgi:hypothetical protein